MRAVSAVLRRIASAYPHTVRDARRCEEERRGPDADARGRGRGADATTRERTRSAMRIRRGATKSTDDETTDDDANESNQSAATRALTAV